MQLYEGMVGDWYRSNLVDIGDHNSAGEAGMLSVLVLAMEVSFSVPDQEHTL